MAIKFHQRLHIPVVLGVGAVGRRAAGLDWILRIQIGGGRRLSIYPVQLIWKRRIKRKRVNGTVHRERERRRQSRQPVYKSIARKLDGGAAARATRNRSSINSAGVDCNKFASLF